MTENMLGTVDPKALECLVRALMDWQRQNTSESTRLLRSWSKRFCVEDAPEALSEEAEKDE